MSITFQKDTAVVTLPDPTPSYAVRALKRQAVGRTAGGTVFVYEKGIGTFEVELKLESLTDVERNALSAFFDGSAQGCMESFAYTDSKGGLFTARFLEPALDLVKVCANVWDARLRLELDRTGG